MKLFEPGKIGKMEVKNRIVMTPLMGPGLIEPDARLSQRGLDYYVARAKGGVGLITIGGVHVSREFEGPVGMNSFTNLMADHTMYMSRINELALALHDYGAKLSVQLTAGFGRCIALGRLRERGGAVAPSSVPCLYDKNLLAREFTIEEIGRLVSAFQGAAEKLKNAEVDAIEIHAHTGYLIDQFLTALWNKRTDKYGGDLNGRLTFLLEVIEAVRKGAGEDFPLICRISLDHFLDSAREMEEGIEVSKKLEEAGIDSLNVAGGCFESREWRFPTLYQPPGCLTHLGEAAKKAVKIPVILNGKLGYPELAEKVLAEGKTDFIALGRTLLADPEWPNKVKEGRTDDIRPCITNMEGCTSRSRYAKYLSCEVNPSAGMERELTITSAEKAKNVLVVGGGPAGMEAARVAALRGHNVTLWEKSDALGGNLIPASAPDFKQDHGRLLRNLTSQINKIGLNIELNKEASPDLIEKMKPDVLFVATGSTPIIPDLKGITNKNVMTAIDFLINKPEVGDSVLVLGGGHIGCDIALLLKEKGKSVTIVEISDQIARDVNIANKPHLMKLLSNVPVFVDTNVMQIGDNAVIISDKQGKTKTIEADNVVIAVGMKSDRKLLESLNGSIPEIHVIGDCLQPRKIINAIWEGFRTARLL